MYGIVANVVSDRILRTGAKVWLLDVNGDAEHPEVMGLNKSGRMVTKFTNYKRLTNFRVAWIPEHLREHICWFMKGEREKMAEYAANINRMWADVRFFNRDGSQMLREGITAQEAFRRQADRTQQQS